MTRSQQSLFLCLFTLCFSVLCQLTVFRACVDVSCHKTRKHRHTRKLSGKLSTAEQHNLRKAFAGRFRVSLWKLTVNANWPQLHSIWNKRDGKRGATKQAECTFRQSCFHEDKNRIPFVHSQQIFRLDILPSRCFIGALQYSGEKCYLILIYLDVSPPSYTGKSSNPPPLGRVRRKDLF